MGLSRAGIIAIGLILLWQAVVWVTGVPPYILPAPRAVAQALLGHGPELLRHAGTSRTPTSITMPGSK